MSGAGEDFSTGPTPRPFGPEPPFSGNGLLGRQAPSGDPWAEPSPPGYPLENSPTGSANLGELLRNDCNHLASDYRNYYSWATAEKLALILGVAAPLANTQADNEVRNWYQRDVRSPTSDRIARFWKPFGEGQYMIPAAALLSYSGRYFDNLPVMGTLGDFGDRTARAYAVGAPPLMIAQVLLGSGRPSDTGDNSYWTPFKHAHGASGHAFIAGVPFITAAMTSDDWWEKGFFYACSMMTAWSRVNDDAHYLSEVWLGWWLAYLACDSVNNTQHGTKPLRLVPIVSSDTTGLGIVYQR